MRALIIALTTASSLILAQFAAADGHAASPELQLVAATSSWVNQSGSVASLTFTPGPQPSTYIISGSYVNNAVGYRCQGTPYPLSGIYYAGTQAISFSVAWSNSSEDCQSVTGWTGYFDLSTSPLTLITDWNLAFSGAGGMTILQGSDTFSQSQIVTSDRLTSE